MKESKVIDLIEDVDESQFHDLGRGYKCPLCGCPYSQTATYSDCIYYIHWTGENSPRIKARECRVMRPYPLTTKREY